jgi:hypothetical protein
VFGGAAAGESPLLPGAAGGDERVECLFDAVGGLVALAEIADLGAGESVGWAGERGVDLLGERVAGGLAERPGGGAAGVVPERERRVEMFGLDGLLSIEQRVEEREADDVRFGAGGELAVQTVGGLGELRVGVPPQLSRVGVECDTFPAAWACVSTLVR